MKNKKELRKKAKDIRKTLNIERISKDIIVNIENVEPFQQAKNVMIFYQLDRKLDLKEIANVWLIIKPADCMKCVVKHNSNA